MCKGGGVVGTELRAWDVPTSRAMVFTPAGGQVLAASGVFEGRGREHGRGARRMAGGRGRSFVAMT